MYSHLSTKLNMKPFRFFLFEEILNCLAGAEETPDSTQLKNMLTNGVCFYSEKNETTQKQTPQHQTIKQHIPELDSIRIEKKHARTSPT